jgi:virulence activator alpha
MEDDGWVAVTPVIQHGRPDKKVYAVSDAGRAELARWLSEPLSGHGSAVTDSRTRDLAVKLRGLAFGGDGAVDALRDQVVSLRAERAALLDTYRGFEKHQFPDPATLNASARNQYLVLRGGIRAEQGSVDWLDEILASLGAQE